ncbi:MAG: alpha/beta hydrolase [Bacteroidia bacterium]
MSGIGKLMVPGSRLLKAIAYDRKKHRLRGLKIIQLLSKIALADDPKVKVQPYNFEGLDSAWFTPKTLKSDKVILYLHGGGYAVCSWRTHRTMISYLSRVSGMKILAINYRMTPEFPFPAAVEDATRALKVLMNEFGPEKVIVGGDSAGGGLSFAAMFSLKDQGLPLPGKAFALSPWLNLNVSLLDGKGSTHDDPMLDPEAVEIWAKRYLNGADALHHWASPALGNPENFPPFLIHVGEREMLLNESVEFTQKSRDAGVKASIRIFPDMVHVFQLMHTLVPEARESIKGISEFLLEE